MTTHGSMPDHTRTRPSNPNIALRLQIFMRRKKMTVTELAERLGVSKGAVSHWVNARFEPSRPMLETVAALLGVSVDMLLGANLSEEQQKQEKRWLELLLASPPELEHLLIDLGAERALDALRREAQKDRRKR